MRRLLLILLVCLLAVPAVGAAAASMRGAGDGVLSIEGGEGRIVIDVRGGVIGRFDRGSVTILDRTPDDPFEPKVWGASSEVELGEGQVRHFGPDVRFRLIGGSFRIVINGSGIDLSAVGSGSVSLEGKGRFPGAYSLDGEDCSKPRSRCKALPEEEKRFRLGTVDPPERSSSRVTSSSRATG